jgi:predicted DsbA family dithiol-disulfide isomerase
VPNYTAQAAKEMGITDDRVRLAIAHAAVREGKKMGRWQEAIAVAAQAGGLDSAKLMALAQSPEIARRTEATSKEFQDLQVTQRPAFLIENEIGDRAVFSGIARVAPLAAAIDALLEDEAAYISYKAHFGDVPAK